MSFVLLTSKILSACDEFWQDADTTLIFLALPSGGRLAINRAADDSAAGCDRA